MKTIHVCNVDQKIYLDKPGKYKVVLDQIGSSCSILLINSSQSQTVAEYQLTVHHQAPRTKATAVMKSVVGKAGSVKLVGMIVIDEGAYESSSFLTQRILLLDETARGEAVPELEILNNDVHCSHAASISSIPEEQLHYLMTRGLSRIKATRMIAEGFLRECS